MMKKYELTKTFKRSYRKKERKSQESIDNTVRKLLDNTRHPGLHTHPVLGTKGKIFEAYIDDGTRLTFHYEDGKIIFRNNCNHDKVIKNP
jgi:mRNA-degrading endonuclease YafQ of YafQ-DinJ toxin-antitoxin module